MRILFVRKNKTVSGNFKSKTVLEMLEKNYKTVCSLKGIMVEDGLDIGAKVDEVLQQSGFSDSRVAKMDNDDFLKLLVCFLEAGFRFTAK